MDLKASTREREGVTVVTLEGRLKLGEATKRLRDLIRDLVAQGQRHILLDLEKVDYIDSTGLGTLVASYTTVQSAGGSLKLLHLSKRAREQLVLTKLLTIFEDFDNETDAIASFAGATARTQ